MRFSLLDIYFWQEELSISFCSIETSTNESALFSIGYLKYLRSWQWDLLYYEFVAKWLQERAESQPTTGAVDSASAPCPHGYSPECTCPTCGACVNETPSA